MTSPTRTTDLSYPISDRDCGADYAADTLADLIVDAYLAVTPHARAAYLAALSEGEQAVIERFVALAGAALAETLDALAAAHAREQAA